MKEDKTYMLYNEKYAEQSPTKSNLMYGLRKEGTPTTKAFLNLTQMLGSRSPKSTYSRPDSTSLKFTKSQSECSSPKNLRCSKSISQQGSPVMKSSIFQ